MTSNIFLENNIYHGFEINMVTTTIMEQCDVFMSFSIDNHNGHEGWIITMSFGNKYYECCDVRWIVNMSL